MEKFKLYQVSYSDFDSKIRSSGYIANYDDVKKLIHVTISFLGQVELKEFDNIEEGLLYDLIRGVHYKFIEIEKGGKVQFAYVVEQDNNVRKVYFSTHLYKIGRHWNLFLNSKEKITAQGIGDVPNSNFTFSNDSRAYLYLSVLLYTLTNLQTDTLETEFEANKRMI